MLQMRMSMWITEHQKIICVHILVLLYLLTIMLIEDLAENILIALASQVSGSVEHATENDVDIAENEDDNQQEWLWSVSNWTDDKVIAMKDNTAVLMQAAGEQVSDHEKEAKSLPELLKSFVVGTKHRKEWKERSKVPPKPSKLGPVSDMTFMSLSKRAKLTVRSGPDKSRGVSTKGDNLIPLPPPPKTITRPSNSFACSLPCCSVNEGSPPQTKGKCKVKSCTREVHRICGIEFLASGACRDAYRS